MGYDYPASKLRLRRQVLTKTTSQQTERFRALFLWYSEIMKFKKDEAKTYDLSNLPAKPVEVPQMPVKKHWEPNGQTFTMPYGGQTPRMVNANPPKEDVDNSTIA